ncbi:MAG: MBL fold metallo-hydrolase, partial [Gemmatimonadaceae bacterium]
MIIETFVVGAFQENTYLLADDTTGTAVFIDPGDDGDALASAAAERRLTISGIWLTHAHLDHVGGIAGLLRRAAIPVYMHPADTVVYERAAASAARYGLPFETAHIQALPLAEGDTLALGELRFGVIHVPGHAPGHVAFLGHGVAFVGDCLFAGSIGRTDLPLQDPTQLDVSLRRLAELPPETRVLPGHGPETTIGRELASNPFLTGLAR